MSPAKEVYSRFKEPSNFDSDYASDQDYQRFPSKHANGFTSSGGRSQHYADSEPGSRSRLTSRSSSAKRSRKTSSSTARELVRALIHERLETDSGTEAQLAHAYDIIREESRRAADAERAALETAHRLKGLAISRANAQSDAARAQAELRAYKLQLENAQHQLEEANAIAAASDAERVRAEQTARKLKRAMEKLRLEDEVRRARQEGLREGIQESYFGIPPPRTRSIPRGPLIEDDEDDFPQTPTSNVPLPVPPPASVPIMSHRIGTPILRRVQTPVSVHRDWQRTGTPVPDVVRQRTTPPNRRPVTPALPVHPPASMPILSRRVETPGLDPSHRPVQPVYDEFDPVPEARGMPINPVPDHIIIRSPVPVHGPSQSPPTPQPFHAPRPPSSQASRPTHTPHPPQHHDPRAQRNARHYSLDDPAARAMASASRIYSNYSSSTESSGNEPPPRPPSRILRRRDDLPQQETIVPRPAPGSAQRFSPPARPPSAADSIPASAADFARNRARQRQGQRRSSVSSSSTSSPRAFPTPSGIARLQRLPLGDRTWSAESASSVPGITIEPPSRSESVDSLATGVTLPSHMSPFVDTGPALPGNAQTQGWGMPGAPQPQHHQQPHHRPQGPGQPPRPSSRTGFMYGPPGPTTGVQPHPPGGFESGISGAGTPGPSTGIGFVSPPSPNMTPRMSFGAPGPGSAQGPVIPPRPPSAADYFAGDHHRTRPANGQGPGPRHAPGRGHRREPAGMGASLENLGAVDPNAFHDPATDPSLDSDSDPDSFGRDRAPTPRASAATPYAFDERRAGFDERRASLSGRSATPGPSPGGFVPPRPPSSSGSERPMEGFGYDSPHRVPLPASASTSTYPSRAASVAPGSIPGSKGGRSRTTSFANGGRKDGRPTARTAYGNTPFVRSGGLYDD